MGKNISVYLDDNLSRMVEAAGKSPSKTVQLALKKFFLADNRKEAFDQFAKAAKKLGEADRFREVVSDWKTDRKNDRW